MTEAALRNVVNAFAQEIDNMTTSGSLARLLLGTQEEIRKMPELVEKIIRKYTRVDFNPSNYYPYPCDSFLKQEIKKDDGFSCNGDC